MRCNPSSLLSLRQLKVTQKLGVKVAPLEVSVVGCIVGHGREDCVALQQRRARRNP